MVVECWWWGATIAFCILDLHPDKTKKMQKNKNFQTKEKKAHVGDTAKGSEDTVSTQGTVEINDSGPPLSDLEQE